jgi:EAL domain-containing protein (putative c-di-GMP-specific phosphodiesterase class I)
MHTRAVALLQLETDLRRAIEREEFRVFYQPIYCIPSGEIHACEALVRWQHPQRGLLYPPEFVPVAEETGLILPIGQWVLREACRQMRQWQERFRPNAALYISVNLSNKQFSQPDLAEKVKRALQEVDLTPESLKLEITESVIMEHGEGVTKVLKKLRDFGIDFYIDDFGTGYSSFSSLRRFPISALKIDGTFVRQLKGNGEGSEIVRSIVTLARNLELEVIAEGVETKQQLSQLKALKCQYAQGALFADASEPATIERLLAQQYK